MFRLDPSPGVEWYDVDYPDVIALVKQLYPAREHYHPVAASVTDPAWLSAIPAARPVLLIAEGLTYYLTKEDGIALLRRVVEHFPSGELHFDVCNWLSIKVQKFNPVVRRSGSTLHWAVNEPNDILQTPFPVFACWRRSPSSKQTSSNNCLTASTRLWEN